MLHVLSLVATMIGALGIVFMLACVWMESMACVRKQNKKPTTRWKGEDAN